VEAKLVSKMWEAWRAESLHPGSAETVDTIRRIWFAAALSMFNTMTQVTGAADLSQEDIMTQLELMKRDMEENLEELVGGRGPSRVQHPTH
jgi:hypothetical protein